ncbi:MAG: response regulator [Bacteroidia bacterium]
MNSKKLLIVEDDLLSKESLIKILEGYGYTNIHWVSSGMDAFNYIKENKTDLILMDITLEGKLDGIDTAKIVDNNIPVIFTSSSKDSNTFKRVATTKSFGFLQKPYTPALVKEALDNAFSQTAE